VLRDIAFGENTNVTFTEATNQLSSTLTVTDGKQTVANLTLLGQYSTAMFSLASDGNGGTVVTEHPATVGSAVIPMVAAQT